MNIKLFIAAAITVAGLSACTATEEPAAKPAATAKAKPAPKVTPKKAPKPKYQDSEFCVFLGDVASFNVSKRKSGSSTEDVFYNVGLDIGSAVAAKGSASDYKLSPEFKKILSPYFNSGVTLHELISEGPSLITLDRALTRYQKLVSQYTDVVNFCKSHSS